MQKKYKYLIIGTSFSSFAAVNLLINKNEKDFLICDVGIKDDDYSVNRDNSYDNFIFANNSYIPKDYRDNSVYNIKNFPPPYGSNYFGGFSNIWGGTTLPLQDKDLHEWNLSKFKLEKYKNMINKLIDPKGEEDQINDHFDFNINKNEFKYNKLTYKILDLIKDKEDILTNKNIIIGSSKLSVSNNCKSCGLCLSGCPDHYIFSTSNFFKRIDKDKIITGLKLIEIEEKKNEVSCYFIDSVNEIKIKIKCNKLFLCTGPVETAKILLNSKNNINEINIKDSQSIYNIGFFKNKKIEYSQEFNTLSQIFLESYIQNRTIIHTQVSKIDNFIYNKIFLQLKIFYLRKFLKKIFIKNSFLFHSYLPSKFSSSLEIKKSNKFLYKINENKNINYYKKRVFSNISNTFRELGFSFLPYSYTPVPFSSYHFGSSFPMSNKYKNHKYSDFLGRVDNYKNIHILDSSISPSIKSGPITYNIMLNAARIVDEITDFE